MQYMLLCHTWPRGETSILINGYILSDCTSAGMAFEDGAVIGECLSRLPNNSDITKTSPGFLRTKKHAISVFEKCRKQRTQMVVDRGNIQQYLYHLHDGPEQEERDRKMQMVPTPEGEALAWRDPVLAPKLLGYDHVADVGLWFSVLAERSRWCQVDQHWDTAHELEMVNFFCSYLN